MQAAHSDHLSEIRPAWYGPQPSHDGGVAVEVARLSAEMTAARRDLDKVAQRLDELAHSETGIFVRMARVEESLKHIPTRWGVALMLGTLFVALVAAATVIPTVQRAIGIIQ